MPPLRKRAPAARLPKSWLKLVGKHCEGSAKEGMMWARRERHDFGRRAHLGPWEDGNE